MFVNAEQVWRMHWCVDLNKNIYEKNTPRGFQFRAEVDWRVFFQTKLNNTSILYVQCIFFSVWFNFFFFCKLVKKRQLWGNYWFICYFKSIYFWSVSPLSNIRTTNSQLYTFKVFFFSVGVVLCFCFGKTRKKRK